MESVLDVLQVVKYVQLSMIAHNVLVDITPITHLHVIHVPLDVKHVHSLLIILAKVVWVLIIYQMAVATVVQHPATTVAHQQSASLVLLATISQALAV